MLFFKVKSVGIGITFLYVFSIPTTVVLFDNYRYFCLEPVKKTVIPRGSLPVRMNAVVYAGCSTGSPAVHRPHPTRWLFAKHVRVLGSLLLSASLVRH